MPMVTQQHMCDVGFHVTGEQDARDDGQMKMAMWPSMCLATSGNFQWTLSEMFITCIERELEL